MAGGPPYGAKRLTTAGLCAHLAYAAASSGSSSRSATSWSAAFFTLPAKFACVP